MCPGGRQRLGGSCEQARARVVGSTGQVACLLGRAPLFRVVGAQCVGKRQLLRKVNRLLQSLLPPNREIE